MSNRYSIAKYYRLSSEDDDLKLAGKLESNSISNQRNLVESFIAGMPELADAPSFEYFDDGWSGKNFERPNVQRMLEDVRQGKINCIIVKDLSRFGRDYLAVGNYISRVFPFLQVRFIAINDGFDSIRPVDVDSLETSFKTLLYDLYSRDLSRKVRSAKLQRAKRGDFQSPFAPFGFVKDPENKKCLKIDPEAAAIVRSIFELAASGVGAEEIAKRLNRDGTLTQMMYKREAGCSRSAWPCVGPNNFWTRHSVTAILRDERYVGKVIYGKRTRPAIGDSHTIKNQRTDWVIVENAHQGIVTEAEYRKAQDTLREFCERDDITFHNRPLERKVRCGICGHVMTRINSKEPYYYCSTPKVTDAYACPTEQIPESDIMELLHEGLLTRARAAVNLSELWRERHRQKHVSTAAIQKELTRLSEDLVRQNNLIKDLYESFASGKLDKAGYLNEKANEVKKRNGITSKIAELETQLSNMSSAGELKNRFADTFRQYVDVGEITKEIAGEVLDGIMVFPDYRLEVCWNYQNEHDSLVMELHSTENTG